MLVDSHYRRQSADNWIFLLLFKCFIWSVFNTGDHKQSLLCIFINLCFPSRGPERIWVISRHRSWTRFKERGSDSLPSSLPELAFCCIWSENNVDWNTARSSASLPSPFLSFHSHSVLISGFFQIIPLLRAGRYYISCTVNRFCQPLSAAAAAAARLPDRERACCCCCYKPPAIISLHFFTKAKHPFWKQLFFFIRLYHQMMLQQNIFISQFTFCFLSGDVQTARSEI